MTDSISLRAYLEQVDSLISSNAYDEAIHHARHILQYFPKNAETYRLLGRALLYNGRMDEAAAVFKRVLSVYPDDAIAHAGLSEAYLERNRPNDGIWHLERAYEQNPNNRDIIETLRDLYRRHRNIDQPKVQLTAGAVARQYTRSGMYEQAANALRSTLQRTPDRLDLRLLLAQTLWGEGQRVEAAEIALDILQKLPDCLEANRIMTELWLSEERPSDAQRYLSHIEAVDPYFALEVATGNPAAENAFTLEELDYRRFAAGQASSAQPDWLRQIDSLGGTSSEGAAPAFDTGEDWSQWLGSVPQPDAPTVATPRPTAPAEPAAPLFAPDADEMPDEMPDDLDLFGAEAADWLNNVDEMRQQSLKQTSALHHEFEEPDWQAPADQAPILKNEEDVDLPDSTIRLTTDEFKRETSTHANIFAKKTNTDELPAWLGAASEAASEDDDALSWMMGSSEELEDEPASDDENDPLAWLRGSGVTINDDAQRQRPTFDADEDEDFMHVPDAPLAWMQEAGIEVEDEPASDDENDPLAWLRDSGVTIDDAAQRQRPMFDADEPDLPHAPDDPMAWMRDSGIELDDDFAPDLFSDIETADAPQPPDTDPMAWLRDSGVELTKEDAPDLFGDAEPAAPQHLPATDPLAWMRDSGVELADKAEQPPTAESETDDSLMAWLQEDEQQDSPAVTLGASEDSDLFEWLQDESLADNLDDEETPDEGMFDMESPSLDWLNDETEIGRQSDFDPNPHKQTEPLPRPDIQGDEAWREENAILDAGSPEFMGGDDPAHRAPASAERPSDEGGLLEPMSVADRQEDMPDRDDTTPDWMQGQPDEPGSDDESPDWLSALDSDDTDVVPAEPADVPDWLSALGPDYARPETVVEASTESDEAISFDTDDDDDMPLAPADLPDWMADAAPADLPAPATPGQADAVSEWMSNLDLEDEPPAAEPASGGLEWLSQSQPVAEEPEAEDAGFEWMSTLNPEDEPAAEPNDDVPDWMADAAPIASVPEAAQDEGADFEWMGGVIEDEGDAEPEAMGDVPDWLAASQPIAPVASEEDTGSEFGWDVEDEPPVPAEIPDWMGNLQLTEVEDDEAAQPADQPAPGFDANFEWLGELQTAQDEPTVESKHPIADLDDNMDAAMAPGTAAGIDWSSNFEDAVAEGDEPSWLRDISDEDAAEPAAELPVSDVAEGDVPDWLSEMQPAEAISEPEPEAAPAASSDFDWSAEIDQAEAVEDDVAEWLSAVEPKEGEARVETVEPGEQPGWLQEWEDAEPMADESQPEPEAAANVEYGWLIDVQEAESAADAPTEAASGEEEPVTSHAPAENAPDWLNAMVPGVDLDYDAPEDAPVETEFTEGAAHRTREPEMEAAEPARDFQWLNDMVEEESQEAAPVVPAAVTTEHAAVVATTEPAAVAAPAETAEPAPEAPRFVFSKPPAWLRGKSASSTSSMSDLPSDVDSSDQDDFDVPDWLK